MLMVEIEAYLDRHGATILAHRLVGWDRRMARGSQGRGLAREVRFKEEHAGTEEVPHQSRPPRYLESRLPWSQCGADAGECCDT